MADMLANLGGFLLEKKESAEPTNPRDVTILMIFATCVRLSHPEIT
jgi:hypothetical protein